MLTLSVRLLDGRYDAATSNTVVPEWPPHPARAFCALVAGAREAGEWDALRWLERQPMPDVLAAPSVKPLRRQGFVVTNKRENAGGSQTHLARTNQLRDRASAQPSADQIHFEWSTVDADAADLAALDRLALRMPYLGRSTGHVMAQFSSSATDDPALVRYQPTSFEQAEATLRVPYEGYVEELISTYDDGLPGSHAQNRLAGYRVERPAVEKLDDYTSPFGDLVVLRFHGVRPNGELAYHFSDALRRAVMSRTPNPLPPALHGHGADDVPHVAFLPLLNVGHEKFSRGQLLGLGVAVPRDLEAAARRAVLQGLINPDGSAWTLRVDHVGDVDVVHDPAEVTAWGARERRWRGPAKVWSTATPFAFDRHPKKADDWADLVRDSFGRAGYPRPIAVDISEAPLLPGAVQIPTNELPPRLRSRVRKHVSVEFDRPLRGPLAVGAGRYLGIGLFAPVAELAL